MNSTLVCFTESLGAKKQSADSSGEKIFQLALVFSVILHSLLLVVLFAAHVEKKKTLAKIHEIIYRTERKPEPVAARPVQEVRTIREKSVPTAPKVLTERKPQSTAVSARFAQAPDRLLEHKKTQGAIPDISAKRRIAVPVLQSEKMASPRYMNYNERIRDKIKNRASSYVDDQNFREGEVYLTFVVLANGALKELQVIDEKTRATDFLKNVGLRSIRESSPFPPFPDDLKYPELSFNVVISFQVEK